MIDRSAPFLLGGSMAPAGIGIAFIGLELNQTLDELRHIRRDTRLSTQHHDGFETGIAALDPMESPWTTELVIDCGEWTCTTESTEATSPLSPQRSLAGPTSPA